MIKYIIFDFDGTLVDSKDIAISVYNEIAEKYKYKKMEQENIEYLRGISNIERAKYLNIPVYKIPFLALESYNLYKHSIKNLLLFDGIKELLDELNDQGYGIAVISSNSESNIRELFENNQMTYIKDVFCSNNIFGKDKIMKKFLDSRKLSKSEVIYVGDEHRDIVACKKAGVRVIWVEWGFDVFDTVKEENPDFIAKKPGDILKIIKSS